MSSLATASIVFACVFGAALIGMILRTLLPQHHLSAETKDAVKVSMGLVATTTALVLGLLVASAKGAYDTDRSEVIQMAAKIGLLDRELAAYGPEAAEVRGLLKAAVTRVVAKMWPDAKAQPAQLDPATSRGDVVYDALHKLTPVSDSQRALKSQALSGAIDLGQLRWMLFEQSGSSISIPLLVVVVTWLTIIFLSFGLFSPPNATVIVSLKLAALSVSGAILLILELDRPFDGLIQISAEPMRNVLSHLGQ